MFGYNTVESGYLKGGAVKLSSWTAKPYIVKKGLLGKTKINLDKHTVRNYEVLSTYNVVGDTNYKCRIVFQNNKECTVNIHHLVYDAIVRTIS